MLRMSKLADYGVLLLIQVAREGETLVTARNLATKAGVPLPTTVKLLKRFERGGVLVSERGPMGGYRLARPAEQISIVDIVAVVDVAPALTRCTAQPAKACDLEATCPARRNWRLVNRLITETLAGLTLAAMAGRLTAAGLRKQFSIVPPQLSTA